MSKGTRLTDLAQPVLTAPARELLASVTPDMVILEAQEILARERRTLFVSMTRAMRALLLVVPAAQPTSQSSPRSKRQLSPLLQSFDPAFWNLGNTDT